MTILPRLLLTLSLLLGPLSALADSPRVLIKTSMGDITLQLDQEKAPKTVENFLAYVDAGFYDGTIFHRVIKGFMIQGGGLDADMQKKATRAPVENEARNGLKNQRGSIAMARTSAPHSATAQFFINHRDNVNLDYPSFDGWGYAVFGEVADGMDVVDAIAAVPTTRQAGRGDVPVETILIESVSRLP
ncbi:MAG: peptidyl-prolyl cis-trans isomerase [Gammaproteobacteria bacterium]|nr:peptidyl-prolyl cis-trans isomerase [Gammaproteobacteria bacterium]